MESNQNKDGFTQARSQRYRCKECGARYTPKKKKQGYPKGIHTTAIRMYADGLNFRQIGRNLKVSHTTVMKWVKGNVEKLSETPISEEIYTIEMDEQYTFVQQKKTEYSS